MSEIKKVTVLAAGDILYVFDAKDMERSRMQYLVCVGANLDVEMVDIPENRLKVLVEKIKEDAPDMEVEDCRI